MRRAKGFIFGFLVFSTQTIVLMSGWGVPSAQGGEPRLVSSGPEGVVLEMEGTDYRRRSVLLGGRRFDRVELPGATWLPEVGAPGFAGYMEKYHARVSGMESSSKEGHATLTVDKGHFAMLDAFVESIIHDRPSPCDELAGYLSVYLARQAIRSLELRQALPIPIDRVCPAII